MVRVTPRLLPVSYCSTATRKRKKFVDTVQQIKCERWSEGVVPARRGGSGGKRAEPRHKRQGSVFTERSFQQHHLLRRNESFCFYPVEIRPLQPPFTDHKILSDVGVFGGYQGVWRMSNPLRYFGGSDSRKDGCAVGY